MLFEMNLKWICLRFASVVMVNTWQKRQLCIFCAFLCILHVLLTRSLLVLLFFTGLYFDEIWLCCVYRNVNAVMMNLLFSLMLWYVTLFTACFFNIHFLCILHVWQVYIINQNEAKSLFRGHCLLHAHGRFIGALVPEVPLDPAGSRPDQAHHLPGAQVPRPL